MIAVLDPGYELILLLAGQDVTEERQARARELVRAGGPRFPWATFLDQANQHRVAALLSPQVRALTAREGLPEFDPAVLSALRAIHFYTARRNEVMAGALAAVLTAADAAGVPVVVRKGGYLAYRVYRDPALRPMGDLDVLVDRGRAAELLGVLTELGYAEGGRAAGETRPLSRRERLFWHLYGSDLPKLNRHTGDTARPVVSIDVNVSLALPGKEFDIPVGPVLERATRQELVGAPAYVMDVEDTVIDLCSHIYKNSTALRFMHAGKHRRLLKYVDVAEYLAANRDLVSWPGLVTRVAEANLVAPVYYGLAHLALLFPAAVDVEALAELRGRCPDAEQLLSRFGQWDLPEPMTWEQPFPQRLFDRAGDALLPASRSLV
ncbi:nucleotidyltransferase domain-containing protein [Micromonospora echinofusca]|uniref:nucleotidyltransferase domain-containing protein n=1 Tax=Micromonospora echinofusca TaxID=47858 RepID=UPI0033CFAB63